MILDKENKDKKKKKNSKNRSAKNKKRYKLPSGEKKAKI